MKTVLLTAVAILGLAGSANAVEFRTPVTKQLYTCAAPGVSRVADLRDQAGHRPAPCCVGKMKCAQFLSTTGIFRTLRDPRT